MAAVAAGRWMGQAGLWGGPGRDVSTGQSPGLHQPHCQPGTTSCRAQVGVGSALRAPSCPAQFGPDMNTQQSAWVSRPCAHSSPTLTWGVLGGGGTSASRVGLPLPQA